MKRLISASLLAVASTAVLAEDFSFDPSEFEKKTVELNGYVEGKFEALNLRTDGAGYKLAYPSESANKLARATGTLDLSGKINTGALFTDLHTQSYYAVDRFKEGGEEVTIMDGGMRWSVNQALTLDIGKRVQRWGKGYAWNPVGFIERPKDASDPSASREGYVMASADYVTTFDGPLSTLGLTAAVVPVKDDINRDFGKESHANPAAKIYMLLDNTDIDLMWQGQGSRPASVGADFSRNLYENLEIHGEWARSFDVKHNVANSSGTISSTTGDVDSYLLGVRYLTANEITWTAEYYHNGNGYNADEMAAYYQFIDNTVSASSTSAQLAKAKSVGSSGYAKPNPGKDYAYLRASLSEPFGWVYTSSALTGMANLHDGSFQLTPEFAYTGIKNLEIRSRLIATFGDHHSDFGEKTAAQKFEIYARYFF